jgi:hypothetical protein
VDFAMAASLNGFSTSLAFPSQENQYHSENYYFYHRALVKKEHYMTHLWSYKNTVL